MKNITLRFLILIAFSYFLPAIGFSQSYNDLIITKKQDTLWCYITDVVNNNITYDFHKGTSVHKGFIALSEVRRIELSASNSDNFNVYYDISGNILINPTGDVEKKDAYTKGQPQPKASNEERLAQMEKEIQTMNDNMAKSGRELKKFTNAYYGGFTLTLVSSMVLGIAAVTPVGATVVVIASVGVLVGQIIVVVAHSKIGRAGEIMTGYEEW
jgi:hypothetical protein